MSAAPPTGEDAQPLPPGDLLDQQVGRAGLPEVAPLQGLFQNLLLGVQGPLCNTAAAAAAVTNWLLPPPSDSSPQPLPLSPSSPSSTASKVIQMSRSPAGTFLMNSTWLVSSSAHMVGDTCRGQGSGVTA